MGLFDRRRPAIPEQRDPKAALVQIQSVGRGMPQNPKLNADRAVTLGYLGNVVAYRCIEVIAQALAAVPFRAGMARPDAVTGVAPYNPDARLAQLLGPGGQAAPGVAAATFWAWIATQRKATGRAAAEIEPTRDGNGIAGLWPLVSARLDAIPTNGGVRPFARFEYGPWNDKRKLDVDDVFYVWDPHPEDYRQARSSLLAAQNDLAIALQSARYTEALFRNNAVPDTLLVIPEFGDDEQREAFQRQWAATHQGSHNAGKTQFFEAEEAPDGTLKEAVAVHRLGMTTKDARLIEQHRESLQHIAIALGVPWSMLDASGRTFDNAKQEDLAFWQNTMLPLISALEGEVNAQIAPRVGGEVGWFDLSNVDALRPALSTQDAITLAQAGYISSEEVRLRAGFAGPPPASDTPTPDPANVEVPDGQNPVERGVDRPARGAGSEGRRAGEAEAEGGPPEGRREAVAEGRATADQEARRRALWTAHDTAVTALERQFERAFRRLFARQLESTLTRLEGNARSKRVVEGRARADEVFDPGFWTAQTVTEAQTLFEALQTAAFVRLSERFGVSFDLEAEYARTFIEARANQLAGQVTQTTYDAIKGQLSEGVAAGEDIPSIASRVRSVFADATATRATTIARTEVIGGFGAATRAAITGLPASVVAGVQWISTRDGRTRDSHAAADGQIVSVAAPFQIGGASMLYPGDPAGPSGEVVNCRCALAALTPDEFEAEAAAYDAAPPPPIPLDRAKAVLAMVAAGDFDEVRVRRALAAA